MLKQVPLMKLVAVVASAGAVLLLAIFSTSILETNDAGFVQVKQAAITGDMTCRLQPGTYFQSFGDIHTYAEAHTFYFTADADTGERRDQSLPTQFNDGAKARVSGSVRVLLPVNDCESMIVIHRKFKSMDGVVERLVKPALRKALFASGPHMTSAESYAERRNEFANLVEDQLTNGTIKVDQEPVKDVDLVTGVEKTVMRVRKIPCENEDDLRCVGGYARDPGVFREFHITLTNFVIDDVIYPAPVLEQIEQQRMARMDIITQEAEAKKAEARAKKAAAEAEAAVAETRAKEEVEKTQRIVRAEADKAEAVLQAEKKRQVAELEKDAAAFEKQRQILLGEGEAARKRLVMQADGALQQKLDAWVRAQEAYATALANAKPGALVPQFQMGMTSGQNGNAQDLLQLLTAKTARDLSLDLTVREN